MCKVIRDKKRVIGLDPDHIDRSSIYSLLPLVQPALCKRSVVKHLLESRSKQLDHHDPVPQQLTTSVPTAVLCHEHEPIGKAWNDPFGEHKRHSHGLHVRAQGLITRQIAHSVAAVIIRRSILKIRHILRQSHGAQLSGSKTLSVAIWKSKILSNLRHSVQLIIGTVGTKSLNPAVSEPELARLLGMECKADAVSNTVRVDHRVIGRLRRTTLSVEATNGAVDAVGNEQVLLHSECNAQSVSPRIHRQIPRVKLPIAGGCFQPHTAINQAVQRGTHRQHLLVYRRTSVNGMAVVDEQTTCAFCTFIIFKNSNAAHHK